MLAFVCPPDIREAFRFMVEARTLNYPCMVLVIQEGGRGCKALVQFNHLCTVLYSSVDDVHTSFLNETKEMWHSEVRWASDDLPPP